LSISIYDLSPTPLPKRGALHINEPVVHLEEKIIEYGV
jgi:hypothetical protein